MASTFREHCVFCQICGENPAGTELLVSAEDLVAIRDIRPIAKHHFLVVAREHIRNVKSLTKEHKPLLQRMVSVAEQVLRDHNADMADYTLGFHWPPFCFYAHLHLHVFSPTTGMKLINRIFFKENSCWFVSPEFVMSKLECQ
ncbi:histidine triad nucleotide-binding protein 3-like [Thrips palmi]|uniref:Adenosine 5'-monophosphoramidase HINT3 n=1 Tax=Thrips palmi TaxID=161013 RepID=A0A6P8YM23_THRPL|nr:histidine triad nucleotide-binding protein 3-like [Thrips palmi]